MTCGDIKDLPRRTAADKVLCNKAFDIVKNSKYDGYQPGLISMVYKLSDKNLQIQAKVQELILTFQI